MLYSRLAPRELLAANYETSLSILFLTRWESLGARRRDPSSAARYTPKGRKSNSYCVDFRAVILDHDRTASVPDSFYNIYKSAKLFNIEILI